LLANALNFTTEGSAIISLYKDSSNNEWIVSVKDSGHGISPDIFPRLFARFATKSQDGIGLGLHISKSIIEKHGAKYGLKTMNKRMELRLASLYL
jgi:signal transduction histidine kinase